MEAENLRRIIPKFQNARKVVRPCAAIFTVHSRTSALRHEKWATNIVVIVVVVVV